MIQWVFVDVGNVLFIDEQYLFRRYEALHDLATHRDVGISFEQLMQRREELVRVHNDPLPFKTLAEQILGDGGWEATETEAESRLPVNWLDRNMLVPAAPSVLAELSRDYCLALAANQSPACRAAMTNLGLLKFFSIVGLSAELGIGKPSAEFYRALLSEAGCQPQQAVMVGDRFDNDVVPAKRLGMKAVLVQLDFESEGYVPASERERRYLASLRRAPSRGEGHCADRLQADIRVEHLRQLPQAIRAIKKVP